MENRDVIEHQATKRVVGTSDHDRSASPGGYRPDIAKCLSDKSNWINKASHEQLVAALAYHNLPTGGHDCVLRKRLKYFMKNHILSENASNSQDHTLVPYPYLLVIDFEATCDVDNSRFTDHEIIEFPIIIYDVLTEKEVDIFHYYCRPVKNPRLSEFCKQLTKIKQEDVDAAKTFPDVLEDATQFLQKHHMFSTLSQDAMTNGGFTASVGDGATSSLTHSPTKSSTVIPASEPMPGGGWRRKFAVMTDCNADMAKFMRIQCELSGIPFPSWCKEWINLRKAFRNYYQVPKEQNCSLDNMLSVQGLERDGQAHAGIDDARNILKVAQRLIADGCELRINERISKSLHNNYTESISRTKAIQLYQTYPAMHHVANMPGPRFYQPTVPSMVPPRRMSPQTRMMEQTRETLNNESEESIEQLMFYMSLQNRRN